MRRAALSRLTGVAFIGIQLLTAGCDPGMTVRQTDAPSISPVLNSPSASHVIVHVKATSQLIGEKWYDPEIQITNSSNSPIIVIDVALLLPGKSLPMKAFQIETVPLTIQPGATGSLGVGFHLDNTVYDTFFRHPAELWIQYQSRTEQKLSRVSIVGGN